MTRSTTTTGLLALAYGLAATCKQVSAADPPFDLTKVLFSGVFTDHAILQRAPSQAQVYGTATPGASVTVTLTGLGGYHYTSAPVTVATSSDPTISGTWKVVLPARPAGLNYTVEAKCINGCPNTTSVTLSDIGFGDVYLCSGQR